MVNADDFANWSGLSNSMQIKEENMNECGRRNEYSTKMRLRVLVLIMVKASKNYLLTVLK